MNIELSCTIFLLHNIYKGGDTKITSKENVIFHYCFTKPFRIQLVSVEQLARSFGTTDRKTDTQT